MLRFGAGKNDLRLFLIDEAGETGWWTLGSASTGSDYFKHSSNSHKRPGKYLMLLVGLRFDKRLGRIVIVIGFDFLRPQTLLVCIEIPIVPGAWRPVANVTINA